MPVQIDAAPWSSMHLTSLDRSLLNDYQRDFPLSADPWGEIANRHGVTRNQVLERMQELFRSGVISRIGPVIRPRRIGVSMLAAIRVPDERIDEVAELVSSYTEVNHNYEREHDFNLWYVLTGPQQERLHAINREIERRTGLEVMELPMEEDYHIDLGFKLEWI